MDVSDLTDRELLELWEGFDGSDDRPDLQSRVIDEIERRNLDL